ncbi:hypothetical protein PaeCFBP13512_18730 [Paenibacillus sp. CFBP13512]|uniref:hypothetical protein n=1 Tax=Paenibacillus sp. CFBP13512 TaxID=2184007 RepID=UPI0010C07086|nr:hypothetical protein [Paenibacillus sp. CFBP13512]TKJ87258.1 hypothetical protein PaeCFBP13512_18730 [Paenibacillus sp. CFBP13512]
MLMISSGVLKNLVEMLVKSARNSSKTDKLIYLKTDGEFLKLYFHGEDLSVEKKIIAEIEEDFEIATSISELDTKVKALPDAILIKLMRTEDGFYIKWGDYFTSQLKLEILPETAPILTVPALTTSFKWAQGKLNELVKSLQSFVIEPSIAQMDAKKVILLGLNFAKNQNGKLVVHATDSHKYASINTMDLEWFDENVVLDMRTLTGVCNVIAKDAGLEIGITKDQYIVFRSGYTTAVCKPLVGNVPNLCHLYKTETTAKLLIDRLELVKLCDRVNLLSPTSPILIIEESAGKIHCIVPGTLDMDLRCSYEGTLPAFAMSYKHVKEAANLLSSYKDSDEIILYIDSPNEPISFGVEGKDEMKIFVCPHRIPYVVESNKKKKKVLVKN